VEAPLDDCSVALTADDHSAPAVQPDDLQADSALDDCSVALTADDHSAPAAQPDDWQVGSAPGDSPEDSLPGVRLRPAELRGDSQADSAPDGSAEDSLPGARSRPAELRGDSQAGLRPVVRDGCRAGSPPVEFQVYRRSAVPVFPEVLASPTGARLQRRRVAAVASPAAPQADRGEPRVAVAWLRRAQEAEAELLLPRLDGIAQSAGALPRGRPC